MGSTGDVGRGERGLQLVLCFSARDKTGGIGSGRTERGDMWAAYLVFWQGWPVIYGGACWVQRPRKSDESGWEVRKGWSVGPTGDVGKGKEGYSWCSVAVPQRRLGDWV